MAYIARSEAAPLPTTPAASAALQHVLQRGASTNSSSSSHANGGYLSNPGTPGVLAEAMRPALRERAISSPAVPLAKKRDIWDLLSGILGKAIQRLVSTNLLKPAVARLLLGEPSSAMASSPPTSLTFVSRYHSPPNSPAHPSSDASRSSRDAARLDGRGGGDHRTRSSCLAWTRAQDCLACLLLGPHHAGELQGLL